MNFEQIIQKLNTESTSERDKGYKFELLILNWFKIDKLYCENIDKIYLWNDFPLKTQFGSGQDIGIDIVAITKNGEYWAIQCKCYDDTTQVSKEGVAKFVAASNRLFAKDTNKPDEKTTFEQRFFIASTNNWTDHAIHEAHDREKPIITLTKTNLENANIDWLELYNKVILNDSKSDPTIKLKEIRPHQQEALEAVHKHLLTHERGKLIMACGTGKTFTSLKIAEQETNGKGFVLFLVPSIALLGQTLREWKYQYNGVMKAICVCSDKDVSKKTKKDEDTNLESVSDLAYPASTDPEEIARQIAEGRSQDIFTVIFSTYQSIEAVKLALDNYEKEYNEDYTLDLIICDEAHRTTGYAENEDTRSAFTKVHDNDFIKAEKRIYMTATPRIYTAQAKNKAKEKDESVLYSMDDEATYGEEMFRLNFSRAVDEGLLTDYKVFILSTSKDLLEDINFDDYGDLKKPNVDDLNLQARIMGSVSALSKLMMDTDESVTNADPNPMKRAVAFCGTIALSRYSQKTFDIINQHLKEHRDRGNNSKKILIHAKHIDGSMNALQREQLLDELKSEPAEGTCNILTNAKCLSEGVDVPSLDAVIFLSPKKSKADIVQSVGRVMRLAPNKKYGYIIIPICCDGYKSANEAIEKSDEFAMVWEVLNALRSHDDRIQSEVNLIKAGGKSKIINFVQPQEVEEVDEPTTEYVTQADPQLPKKSIQMSLRFSEFESEFYAKLVEKVGSRNYIENWAKEVADLAIKEYDRINNLISKNLKTQNIFNKFLKSLHRNVNPTITKEQAIEMLTQQMITKPIFEALFGDENLSKANGISKDLQNVITHLEKASISDSTTEEQKIYKKLDEFYRYVKNRVAHLNDSSLSYAQKKTARQEIIKELYGKFFKTAFPRVQEQLGIVYTPIEAVDFMINSVDDILKAEFGKSIADEGIKILDPFTGTGTFITRLLEKISSISRKNKDVLRRKFKKELNANEIVLLAYYIASVNIEMTYRDLTNEYLPFKKLCLQDTFLSYEAQYSEENELPTMEESFFENAENSREQRKDNITVIIGNPPYSVGQKSVNDNAQNQSYPRLDEKITNTYVKETLGNNPKSIYDSYIKAFRYATDRIKNKGIICFITNGGWIESNSADGFRKCLEKEFDKIYIYNLRGDQRTKGEKSRQEGGKIFGSGSRTSVSIVLLVKNRILEKQSNISSQPSILSLRGEAVAISGDHLANSTERIKTETDKISPAKHNQNESQDSSKKAVIKYCDIGDYLSREEKLAKIEEAKSFVNLGLIDIEPDKYASWLNKRDSSFDEFIPLYPEKKFDPKTKSFFTTYSLGYNSKQDSLFCNFSRERLQKYFSEALDFYNFERERYQNSDKKISIEDFVNRQVKLSFNDKVLGKIKSNEKINFNNSVFRNTLYRPFCNFILKYELKLLYSAFQMPKLFPNDDFENIVICTPNTGNKNDFSCLISDKILDLHFLGDEQAFPLYWYEMKEKRQGELDLFSDSTENQEEYIRHDGISDWILKRAKDQYSGQYEGQGKELTKEDIFYYVYGFLHLESYRKKFANNLKNELPKIPLVEDYAIFEKISRAGRDLADLHLNFEPKPKENATAEEYQKYEISKVRQSDDKTKLFFYKKNGDIFEEETLDIPPEVEKWQINGSTCTWWIEKMYKITTDPKTGRINDPNDYAREYGNPRYIFELAENVINIAVRTVAILDELNKIEVEI